MSPRRHASLDLHLISRDMMDANSLASLSFRCRHMAKVNIQENPNCLPTLYRQISLLWRDQHHSLQLPCNFYLRSQPGKPDPAPFCATAEPSASLGTPTVRVSQPLSSRRHERIQSRFYTHHAQKDDTLSTVRHELKHGTGPVGPSRSSVTRRTRIISEIHTVY